jgi:hypothetical protein
MHYKFLYLIFFVITFSACQKEASLENGSNPVVPVTSPDSTYLSKIYKISFDGAVLDTVEITNYFYDASKRVTRLTLTGSNIPGSSIFRDEQYFYNGTDTLPYKSVNIEYLNFGAPTTYTTTSFFYYNAAGQKIADSIIQTAPNSAPLARIETVNHYQYAAGKIYGTGQERSFFTNNTSSIGHNSMDTATLDGAGNLISNRKHKQYNPPSAFANDTIISVITYDAKPSPFARLSNYKAYTVFPSGETVYDESAQKNNRLHITETTTGNITGYNLYDEDFTGLYTYHANGYPKEIFIPNYLSTNPGNYFRFVFTYTAL